MRSFWAAVGCLTIFPVGPRGMIHEVELGASFLWFPPVGLLVGGVLVGVHMVMSRLVPPFVAAACVLAVWVMITGALHLDGLADVCDGLYGGRTPEERLRIMKDPHVGAMAVVAVCVLLILKVTLIGSLSQQIAMPALLLSPCLGRYAMVWLGTTLSYARAEGGVAEAFVRSAGTQQPLWGASAVAFVAAGLLLGVGGVGIVLASLLVTCILRAVFRRTLGGVTGDALGAAGELIEVVTLLAVVTLTEVTRG